MEGAPSSSPSPAASCGVMVRVTGPDPKGLKADGRAFYSMEGGRTTLSASGFLCSSSLCKGSLVVVTSAALLAPFVRVEEGEETGEELIQGCLVDVFVEGHSIGLASRLVAIARPRKVVEAAESLLGTRIKPVRGVHVGAAALLEVVAVGHGLRAPALRASSSKPARGDSLLVQSSPFGLVSPSVFQNSVTTGVVSNVVERSGGACLLLTDARCLPGSEGGAVFNASGQLVGMVAPTFKTSEQTALELGAIVPLPLFAHQLGLEFDEYAGGSGALTSNRLSALQQLTATPPLAELPAVGRVHSEVVEHCAASVVLICVNASWGSGVVVSDDGFIISCAHLFRPFVAPDARGRLRLRNPATRITVVFRDALELSAPTGAGAGVDRRWPRRAGAGAGLGTGTGAGTSAGAGTGAGAGQSAATGGPRPATYQAELVFCSKGAVDVALLHVVEPSASGEESPCAGRCIALAPAQPVAGQACVAVGHAIFDPATELRSTVSAGVISKVVRHPRDQNAAAILQTCAHVFRGHSGGLLADARGRLIGILTSNARHSNGSIIPSINFSIPLEVVHPLLGCATGAVATSYRERVFDEYDREDPELLAMWRLEGALPPHERTPQHPAPLPLPQQQQQQQQHQGDAKTGSRFAEFLAQLGSKL
jgi:S1-C subfamily serine protease